MDRERRQGRVGPYLHLVPRDGSEPQRTEERGACGRRGAVKDANACACCKGVLGEVSPEEADPEGLPQHAVYQIIPKFGAETPIKNRAWDANQLDGKTGRQVILNFKKEIEGSGSKVASEKMLKVMRGVFTYSIDLT